ncbi:glucuronosyltransferase [Salinarimonas sp.]|uniref:glucuronosyltransferase n=1 Tax=Salinarimonas sp. TaxID=2766526 RepID=UPI00391CB469
MSAELAGGLESVATARVVAVASKGGHWEQMLALREVFDGVEAIYVTTDESARAGVNGVVEIVGDCSRSDVLSVLRCAWQSLELFLRYRPRTVVSTGAAPGLIMLFWARLFGARTIWIDSVANVEKLSMSGRIASYFVHHCFTQWPHVATSRVRFVGSVL